MCIDGFRADVVRVDDRIGRPGLADELENFELAVGKATDLAFSTDSFSPENTLIVVADISGLTHTPPLETLFTACARKPWEASFMM